MSWAWAIPAGLQALGAISGRANARSQNSNQLAWNQYNAGMQRGVDKLNNKTMVALGMANANGQMAAGKINAALAIKAGEINAQTELMVADFNSRQIEMIAAYNSSIIGATALYNDSLLEDELDMMYEAMDLDLLLMDNQRAVERGAIEGQQAGSGVVMGQDSAAEVLIDSETQGALDAFVVRHNADQEARKISNARAKGIWEAQMSLHQTHWQGQMESFATRTNAQFRASNIMANAGLQAQGALANAASGAASTMAQTQIQSKANMLSSDYRYQAGMAGANMQYSQNNQQIQNNFIQGMFGAATTGAASYFAYKPTTWPKTPTPQLPQAQVATHAVNYQPSYNAPTRYIPPPASSPTSPGGAYGSLIA